MIREAKVSWGALGDAIIQSLGATLALTQKPLNSHPLTTQRCQAVPFGPPREPCGGKEGQIQSKPGSGGGWHLRTFSWARLKRFWTCLAKSPALPLLPSAMALARPCPQPRSCRWRVLTEEVGGEARQHPLRTPEPPEPPERLPRQPAQGWGTGLGDVEDPALGGINEDHRGSSWPRTGQLRNSTDDKILLLETVVKKVPDLSDCGITRVGRDPQG